MGFTLKKAEIKKETIMLNKQEKGVRLKIETSRVSKDVLDIIKEANEKWPPRFPVLKIAPSYWKKV